MLPEFKRLKNSEMKSDPIYSKLFEFYFKGEKNLDANECLSYNTNVIEKIISITCNMNEDELKIHFDINTNAIKILHHNKKGEVILERRFFNISHIGFDTDGDFYKSDYCVSAVHHFKYEDNEDKYLK